MISSPKENFQRSFFSTALEDFLNPKEGLYRLSQKIHWSVFEEEFGPTYSPTRGRPGIPIRVMVALHYLKAAFGESDESVVEKWKQNPYWQYFCGEKEFQYSSPCDPSTLSRWRDRIKEKGLEKLLEETIQCGLDTKVLKRHQVKRVNVDTTVQEKAITYPTDAKLYHRMREKLVEAAKEEGIELRQTYTRKSKQSLFLQFRLRYTRKTKRANYHLRKLKTYLGRVLRDVERKSKEKRTDKMKSFIKLSHRLLKQQRHDKNKIYSLHAPEVECLSKGKAHKKYEFGCKASYVTSSKGNFVLGAKAFHGNPHDSRTLKEAMNQANRFFPGSLSIERVYADQGYRGHKVRDVKVHITGKDRMKKRTSRLRFWLKRRSAIEPIIGHMKNDGGVRRNHLLGKSGDEAYALLTGFGFNIRKLIKALGDSFLRFFWKLIRRHFWQDFLENFYLTTTVA